MFRNGSRIVLLASSISKTIGPKRNSIGYVINSSDSFTLIPYPESPLFAASYLDVMFTRYGKERKPRCEYYGIMALCPAFCSEVSKTPDAEQYAKTLLEGITNGTLSKDGCWERALVQFVNKKRAAVAVALPALSYRLEDMERVPFVHAQAWVESLLRNPRFAMHCRHWYNHKRHKLINVKAGMLRWIADAHTSKKSKKDLLEWAAGSVANRSCLITIIRKLDAIGHHKGLERHIDYFVKSLANKGSYVDPRGSIKLDNYLNILMQNFFEPNILERKEGLLTISENSAVLMDTTVGMRKVRDVMLSLVPKG